MKRIGLWGGSFNPPTLAHKKLADFACEALALDMLLWIVTPNNPEKSPVTLAPFEHRLAMVQQVLKNEPHMQASDIEQHLGSSWTVNTVKHLRRMYPKDHLYFMMGTDNWHGFHLWGDDRTEILDNVSIVVFNRPGYDSNETAVSTTEFAALRVATPEQLKPSESWCIVDNPQIDMSATQARELLAKGAKPTQLAPETLEYIQNNRLYKIDA